ncbi:MAG: T9SS type A sorting domain-containing protein [Saprospiraceae bacterium]
MKTSFSILKSLLCVAVPILSFTMGTRLLAGSMLNKEQFYQWYNATPPVWIYDLSGQSCSYDKTIPQIYLNKVDPSCTKLSSLDWSYFIDISDNCTPKSALIVTFKDSVAQNCNGIGIEIFRTWRVYDKAGNKASVVQDIFTNRVELNQIKYPGDVTAYCPAAQNTGTGYTGVPTYNGEPVDHYCGLTVEYKDFNSKVCGNSISIRRHWTVTDCCNLYATNYDQYINYNDTSKPTIVCPGPITYGTNVKQCYTHQIMPGISVADDCNPGSLTTVVIVDGKETKLPGQLVILGLGKHTFEYHVTDVCGNESICTVQVTVIDGQGPLLICMPIEVCLLTDSVKIGPNGLVSDYWDDCSGLSKVSLKIRKLVDLCGNPFDDLVFKDSVTICCEGVNKTILVEIEASDIYGNKSYCITEVHVTSKIPLKIKCLDSMKLSCGIPIPDLIPEITHCGDYTISTKIIFDSRNGTGVGTVIKRFIIKTANGMIDSCQTVFTIGLGTSAFGADDVTCPPGTVNVQGCSIPDLNGIPGITLKDTARPCAVVTVNLKIDTFNNLGTPCIRIKRTWTINDLLQPALNIVCVQNIDIIDTTKPILYGVHDTTVFASITCDKIVDLPPLRIQDCDTNVVVTNSLNGQGKDIGPVVFPKGMTFIKFKAVDKCGNRDSLTIKVNVIDTSGFRIFCQNDTIVDCGVTFVPRAAVISASCTQVASNILKSDTLRNKCSITKINFKRIITDTSGRKDSCTFMVTFRPADTLFCNQITWPHDTILANCNNSTHPDSLKLKPSFNYIQGACSMVVTSYRDSTSGGNGMCSSILRIWTVKDTCPIPPVVCTYIQTIQVIDNTAPVLKVPKDSCIYLLANGLCDTLLTYLGNATAMDCDPNVVIKNVIIGKTDTAGASLIRRYGLGMTSVLVIAKDACGNIARDTVVITIKDTIKPSPTCKKSNNYLNDQGMVTIHARQFDGGSIDNCTQSSQLRFSWTKDVNDTFLVVNCNTLRIIHAGGDILLDSVKVFPFERNFNLYVTDASGNQDTCVGNRFLAFFDTLNICGKNAIRNTAMINGKVTMTNLKSIPNVIMSAIGDNQYQKMTNNNGAYEFDKINPGIYKLFPYKNDDSNLGVSTADLIAIQRHVLGLELFTQTSQYVAADINKDAAVSTIDLLELRKLILGIYSQFPQNTSWRFFDQSLMARIHDRLAVTEFENPFIEAVEKESSEQDFTGIKIGDVNGSANPSFNSLASRNRENISLILPDLKVSKGQLIEVPVSLDISLLAGIQASLTFDQMSIVGIHELNSSFGHELSFNEALLDKGILNFSWIKAISDHRTDEQILAVIYLRPTLAGLLSTNAHIDYKRLSAEGYTSSQKTLDVNLTFSKGNLYAKQLDRMVLWQNVPNPFSNSTEIKFTIPETGRVDWTITDLTGRVIETWSRQITKGDHTIKLERDKFEMMGIYYYKMDYNGYSEIKKLILME